MALSQNFLLYSAVLCATVGICYYNALDCGFVFDDISAIVDNKDLRPRTPIKNLFWNDFWGTPMASERSHKSYRPLCVLTFRLNYWWNKLEPMSYHLLNVVLHAVVCVMFMRVCQMFLQELPSFIAAMLFAVHPIHTEAVTGVVGRAEALSSVFFLASLMTYARCTGYHRKTEWSPLFATIILVTMAMLCKEQGITVIGVCVVYELFVAQKALFKELWEILVNILYTKPNIPGWLWGSIIRSAVLVGSTVFMLVARIKVMGAQLPVFTNFDNPASHSPIPIRQLTYNYLLPVNFWLLLFPADLCCDWTMGTVPVIKSIIDPRNLATILFYAGLIKMVHKALTKQGRISRALVMCLSLMVLPFIPASNLFFPVGFVVAERILYVPSMGFCMLVALGFDVLLQHKKAMKSVLWLMMAVLCLGHAVQTYTRNIDWTSEYSIFKSSLKVNRGNAKLFNNVGHALEKEQRWPEALEYFQKAASVQPDDIGAHMNVGRTLRTLERLDEAEQAFLQAYSLFPPVIPGKTYQARLAPNHLNVFLSLAALKSRDPTKLEEADKLLETATNMRPDYIQGYINRGDIQMKLGRNERAIEMYETALKYESDNADVLYNLGVVYLEMKSHAKAFEYFERAVDSDPDHWQSLFNSAVMIQETKTVAKWPVAVDRFKHLMELQKNDSKVPFSLAMLLMDMEDFMEAEKYLKIAIAIEPTYKSAMFNLGLMLHNNMKRSLEAVEWMKTLLEMYPDHVKGLMLLGELYVSVVKDMDNADKCFLTLLEHDPSNIEALHNLCVTTVERGDLLRAEKCLEKVHNLAPHEQYILNHLQIVRARIQMLKEKYAEQQKQKAAQAAQAASNQGQGQTESQGQQSGGGQTENTKEKLNDN